MRRIDKCYGFSVPVGVQGVTPYPVRSPAVWRVGSASGIGRGRSACRCSRRRCSSVRQLEGAEPSDALVVGGAVSERVPLTGAAVDGAGVRRDVGGHGACVSYQLAVSVLFLIAGLLVGVLARRAAPRFTGNLGARRVSGCRHADRTNGRGGSLCQDPSESSTSAEMRSDSTASYSSRLAPIHPPGCPLEAAAMSASAILATSAA